MFRSSISSMQKPYQAMVVEGKWDSVDELFHIDEADEAGYNNPYPTLMTVAKDSAFHIAVHSKSEQPLKQLLDRFANNYDKQILTTILNTTNAYENTVLHEAAINYNIKAVKLLVRSGYATPEQILEPNVSGQTPLFKAAAFGSTKVVKYLASRPNQMAESNTKLRDAHRTKYDGSSILHAAVLGENFGIPTGDYDNYDDGGTIDEDKYNVEVGDNISEDVDDKVGDNQNGKWPTIVTKIWKYKRKRKFAFKLAHELIKIDDSWEISYNEDTSKNYKPNINGRKNIESADDGSLPIDDDDDDDDDVETPLLAATRTGVTKLVKKILKKHPQAVEHVSHKMQNILHLAASYRRREIFQLVKKMEIPTRRLIMGIDKEGYTVLHHVADTTNFTEGTRPGPAYQLQEELEWFKMVEEIMPSYFTQHLDKSRKTAKELFREKHKNQLEEAQKWIKETSQSCSGVAVLVATVVFAAAFTVPGGTRDDNGLPILLNSPFFLFFTVMDVVSLSCSLTAVVMFLSIVTSPFALDNFRVSLPRRLTLGFALLFMSVATTMLAFTSTVILIIRSDQRRHWTLTLICCAAFVPVSVLALTHFPLFASFIRAWKNIFKFIWSFPPFRFLDKLVRRYLTSKD
ncbi:hypothetical protein LWI28_009815 [Acer negundo]|uniref:PGG domain-containing protein n=1 Tax=Acer negundo TaxID=4023 RepID=A0AAD5JNU8_ACENE|nr:hypothetical protein LWI28_009815 [Acer negundo]